MKRNYTSKPVLGISPTGQRLRFKGISEICDLLGFPYYTIWCDIDRSRVSEGGWVFSYFQFGEKADADASAVIKREEPTTEEPGTTQESLPPSLRHSEELFKESDGWHCVAKGYHLEGFNLTVCPGCKKFITAKDSTSKYKHIASCLSGKYWSIKFGVIKVWERE